MFACGCKLKEKSANVNPVNKNNNSELITIKDAQITRIVPFGKNDDEVKVHWADHAQQFETPFARIKPFILAYGREMICNIMRDNVKSIVKCHTDGIYSSKKLNVPTGDKLGELSYKGFCMNASTNASNQKVEGQFIL